MNVQRIAGLTAFALASLALAAPATAQMSTRPAPAAMGGVPMLTADADRIAQVMADAGYQTTRSTDAEGMPKLDGDIDGWSFSVYFYGCRGTLCDAIQFAAGFDEDQPMDQRIINDWNRNTRFGRAYLDEEGDPWVEYDINMEGDGVSVSNFNESLAYWDTIVKQFTNHIGW